MDRTLLIIAGCVAVAWLVAQPAPFWKPSETVQPIAGTPNPIDRTGGPMWTTVEGTSGSGAKWTSRRRTAFGRAVGIIDEWPDTSFDCGYFIALDDNTEARLYGSHYKPGTDICDIPNGVVVRIYRDGLPPLHCEPTDETPTNCEEQQ